VEHICCRSWLVSAVHPGNRSPGKLGGRQGVLESHGRVPPGPLVFLGRGAAALSGNVAVAHSPLPSSL
jgi:hypothetical protein